MITFCLKKNRFFNSFVYVLSKILAVFLEVLEEQPNDQCYFRFYRLFANLFVCFRKQVQCTIDLRYAYFKRYCTQQSSRDLRSRKIRSVISLPFARVTLVNKKMLPLRSVIKFINKYHAPIKNEINNLIF